MTKELLPLNKPKAGKVAVIARDVMDMYLDGDPNPYERIVERWGQPRDPITRKKVNAEKLLVWASGYLLSDERRQAMAAKVLEETAMIAFDREADNGSRLTALKLVGQETGVFNNRTESATHVVIDKIENVIVHTKD